MFQLARQLAGALGLLASLAVPASSWAADPVAGGTKFAQNCASCHSVASTSSVDRGRNNPAKIQGAIGSIPQMGFLASLSSTDLEDISSYLGNTPSSLSFASTSVGQTSAAQTLTVRASNQAALNNLAMTVAGSDFARSGGTCGTTLAANGSCTMLLAFTPTAAGARSATLNLTHSGLSTPVTIGLSATGLAATQPTIALDASSLDFGNQTVATASAPRTLTVRNTGSAALNFSAITLGGAAAADFATSGACAVGTPVTAGGNCTLSLVFTPSTTGARSASLTLASNASNGSAAVALTGTGQAAGAPQVTLSPASLSFGNVTVGESAAAQTVTLSNPGSATLNLTAITAASPFSANSTCGATLAAGASCTVAVGFTPTGAGAARGSLTVSSNAAGSPHSVALSGSGALAAVGNLQWTSTAGLDFGSLTVGDDATPQTLTLTNSGTAPATPSAFTLGGANAADFRMDGSSTCAASQALAVGAQCTVVLGFSPTAAGARSATLSVTSADAGTPAPLALAGTGTAPAAPALGLSASSFSFTASTTGSAEPQTLTLQNTGTAELHLSALVLANAHFSADGTAAGGCGATPITLAPGASCTLSLAWSGTTDETGTLTVSGDMQPASVEVALQGHAAVSQPANKGGGGCTLGAGTGAADPLLWGMAVLAGLLAWRRRRAR